MLSNNKNFVLNDWVISYVNINLMDDAVRLQYNHDDSISDEKHWISIYRHK